MKYNIEVGDLVFYRHKSFYFFPIGEIRIWEVKHVSPNKKVISVGWKDQDTVTEYLEVKNIKILDFKKKED